MVSAKKHVPIVKKRTYNVHRCLAAKDDPCFSRFETTRLLGTKGMKELMSSRVVAKAGEPAEIVVGDWNYSTYAEILTW